MKSLYIHIPFCKKKCNYCDFVSFDNKDHLIASYLKLLNLEMNFYKFKKIKTLYIGGGTPSILNHTQLEYLYKNIFKNFNTKKLLESTIEINPESTTLQKLQILKKYNVDRLSIGVQSFNDRILCDMGRLYDTKQFYKKYEMLRLEGFKNINIDLIFGWPGQSIEDLKNVIKQIELLNPEHISLYSLSINKNTQLKTKINKGIIKRISNDLEADMYELAIDSLSNLGYNHYEISNFSKVGFESLHNLTYWNNEEYVGIGLNASSYIQEYRITNPKTFEEYNEMIEKKEFTKFRNTEKLSKKAKIGETIMLNLRLINKGANRKLLLNRFNVDIFEMFKEEFRKLTDVGLISIKKDDKVVLTKKGVMLSNYVFGEFV